MCWAPVYQRDGGPQPRETSVRQELSPLGGPREASGGPKQATVWEGLGLSRLPGGRQGGTWSREATVKREPGLERPVGGKRGACRDCSPAGAGSVQATERQEVGLQSSGWERFGPTKAGGSCSGAQPTEVACCKAGVGPVDAARRKGNGWAWRGCQEGGGEWFSTGQQEAGAGPGEAHLRPRVAPGESAGRLELGMERPKSGQCGGVQRLLGGPSWA